MPATCDKAVVSGLVQRIKLYVAPRTLLSPMSRKVHYPLSSTAVKETTPHRRHVRMLNTGVSCGFEPCPRGNPGGWTRIAPMPKAFRRNYSSRAARIERAWENGRNAGSRWPLQRSPSRSASSVGRRSMPLSPADRRPSANRFTGRSPAFAHHGSRCHHSCSTSWVVETSLCS